MGTGSSPSLRVCWCTTARPPPWIPRDEGPGSGPPRPPTLGRTRGRRALHRSPLSPAVHITTVLDGLAVGYVVDTLERPRDPRPFAEAIRSAQKQRILRAEHFFHMRCEVSTAYVLEDFAPFVEDPLVRLVSLMDHTPGQRQFVRVEKYREYNQGKYRLTDGQLDELIAKRRADQAVYGDRHRAAIVRLCHKHGLPLASHDDTTPRHVEEAVEAGVVIAEFPTTLDAARTAKTYGLAVGAGAPNLVLGTSHSGNVAAAELVANGLLDILSSDCAGSSRWPACPPRGSRQCGGWGTGSAMSGKAPSNVFVTRQLRKRNTNVAPS
ncbi:MAG: alpha-D-ribose 1-methylphosphonate 5-triphosphate diphosphatase [Candidatus Rokuibacteriota bacterium]